MDQGPSLLHLESNPLGDQVVDAAASGKPARGGKFFLSSSMAAFSSKPMLVPVIACNWVAKVLT